MSRASRSPASRNFHLPLPEDVHRELRAEATRAGKPATTLVREALDEWLHARRRAALHAEISTYAERWSGSELDLDPTLEAASVEQLAIKAKTPRAAARRARRK
jgi:hypothetical protein